MKRTFKQFIRFLIIGIIGVGINLISIYIITDLFSVYYLISYFLATALSGLFNFYFNRHWNFNNKKSNGVLLNQYKKFVSINIVLDIWGVSILYILTDILGFYYLYSQAIVLGIIWIILFLTYKTWVFID